MAARLSRRVLVATGLALAVAACSEYERVEPSAHAGTGGSSSGASGMGGGGQAGSMGGGGQAGSMGDSAGSGGSGGSELPDAGVARFSAELAGDTVQVTTEDDIYVVHCAGGVQLVRREGGAWVPLRDDRPEGHNLHHAAHYLDGDYQSDCRQSLGCDVLACSASLESRDPLEERRLIAREYVQVGQASAPSCAELDAGLDPDASSDAASRQVPAIESRVPEGELGVRIQYYWDSGCQTGAVVTVVPIEN
jgi:hypothetical protein